MQPESGRPPEPNDEPLLPPATTRWQPLAQPTDEAALPLAPFFPGSTGSTAAASEGMPWEDSVSVETGSIAPSLAEDPGTESWQPEGAAGDFPPDAFFIPENTLLEADSTLQPDGSGSDAREEDTIVLLEQGGGREEFERDLAEEVAARLEVLAARLREGGLAALSPRSGDPVDTILAAVLSGYVAARAR